MKGWQDKAHFLNRRLGYFCAPVFVALVIVAFGWLQVPDQEARAAVAYRASGTFTSGTGTITPLYPGSMQANDVCLLVVESENQTISLSSAQGFAEVPWSPQSAGTAATDPASRLAVFWKRTVGGDTAPTVADSGNHTTGQIHCFSGVSTSGNPWDTGAGGNDGGANDTSGTIPGATTTVDSTLVVLVTSTSYNGTSTTQCSNWTNANLTNLTERTDNTATSGLGGGHCLATGDKTTAGTYVTTTVTLANTSYKGAISLALIPAPPNPTLVHYLWRYDNGPERTPLNIALICATAACTDANIDVPLKNHLSTTLGHSVTTFIGTNHAWTPTNYDVVVISESTNSGDTAWLKTLAVPILTVEGQNWDEFEMGTGGDSNLGGDNNINITDNTHYITSVFPTGVLQVTDPATTNVNNDLGYMTGWANGVIKLANYNGTPTWAKLSYVDTGGVLQGGVNTAAARRCFFAARYFARLNADGVTIFNRCLDWVTNFAGGGGWADLEDTPLTGLAKLSPIRARVEVSNEGGATTGAMTYRLEYARSTSGPWTTVPATATTEEWEMANSAYITDGAATQNIVPGLTDENTVFVAGQSKDTGSTTGAITLSTTDFTELEYSIRATNNSTNCQTYYFRVTNAGSTTNFTYTVNPQVTLAGSPVCVAPVPVSNLTITAYNSENTITWDNPAANYTQIVVLAKTADCTFTTNPTGIEAINDTVGTGVVIYNGNPTVDLSSTSVTVGGATTVSYTASTQRLVHSGLTDGTVYCYKVYARNGDLIDDNSGIGRPSVTATGTNGVAPSAVWSFNLISTAGATLVQPSLDPGASIYTSYGSGTLASMGATTGLLTWRNTPASGAIQDQSAVVWMSGASTCGLAGATNCIFATSQDGYIYARNAATGAAAWSYRHAAGDVLQGAPSVQIKDYSNGGYTPTVDRLFAATRNATTSANKVYALNPTVAPPTLAWLFTGGGANPAMDMVSSPPVLDYTNNRIYVTSNSNGGTQRSLWVFNTVTGALLSTGITYGGTTLGNVQVAPALSIDGSVLYVGTTAGASSAVKAYNTTTGALNWSFSTSSPVVSGLWVEWRAGLANNLFFTTANGKVWRIKDNGASASDLWGGGAPTLTAASFPVVIPSAGKVYVGGCSGASCASGSQAKLYQLAVPTGTKEQCRILGSNITSGDPALDTVLEQLLVGGSDGKIHTYAAPAGLLGGDPSCTP